MLSYSFSGRRGFLGLSRSIRFCELGRQLISPPAWITEMALQLEQKVVTLRGIRACTALPKSKTILSAQAFTIYVTRGSPLVTVNACTCSLHSFLTLARVYVLGPRHLDSLDLPQSLGRRSQPSDEAVNSCLIAGRWTSSGAPCEKTKLFIEGSPRPRHGLRFLTPFPPCPPLSHVTLATAVTSCFQIKALLRYDSRTVKLTLFKVYRTQGFQ